MACRSPEGHRLRRLPGRGQDGGSSQPGGIRGLAHRPAGSYPAARPLPEVGPGRRGASLKMGIRLCVNAPLEDIRIEQGAMTALKAGGQWLPGDTLLVAAGTAPDTSFLEGTGLLTEGELVVSPALQTADPRIFAAGDVAVIAAPAGRRFSPEHLAPGRLPGKTGGRESLPEDTRASPRPDTGQRDGAPRPGHGHPRPPR